MMRFNLQKRGRKRNIAIREWNKFVDSYTLIQIDQLAEFDVFLVYCEQLRNFKVIKYFFCLSAIEFSHSYCYL